MRVYSWTSPRENIVGYQPWYLRRDGQWQAQAVAAGRRHGKGVIARLCGCEDRDQALALIDSEIGISREQLPPTAPGEYYWHQLIGLRVVNLRGEALGRVDSLLETGANDVLVVRGEDERLIPFAQPQIVRQVDLQAGVIQVDWEKDY